MWVLGPLERGFNVDPGEGENSLSFQILATESELTLVSRDLKHLILIRVGIMEPAIK